MYFIITVYQKFHFCFGGDIYQQNVGVAMAPPLRPVLAGIFMVALETKIIPTVMDSISHWRRFVDDTFVFVKKGCVEHVLTRLNSFHKNIQFAYELENENKLPFVDILLIRRGTKIETTVYRKSTNNDIYLNWLHLRYSHGKEVLYKRCSTGPT